MKELTIGGAPVTADEKTAIIRMKEAGYSLSAIAQETGISRNTIKTFILEKNAGEFPVKEMVFRQTMRERSAAWLGIRIL